MSAVPIVVSVVLLWMAPPGVVANECCNAVQWTNPDWCRASNCKGIGCQFDDPGLVA